MSIGAVASLTKTFTVYLTQSGEASKSSFDDPKWSRYRQKARAVLESSWCGLTIALVIMCNMVLIIYETNVRADDPDAIPVWVKPLSIFFLVVYSVELSVRLYVERCLFFVNAMNLLDCFVVVADMCAEILDGDLTSSAVLRTLRIARLLRSMVRTVRIMKYFRELYLMMHGLVAALKALTWAFILIMLVLTICAIVAVEVLHPINMKIAASGAYDNCERCPRAFSSVQQATLTFIQQIIAGDSWGKVSIPIIEQEPWTALIFLFVLLSVNIGLLNLVLTVIVDSAHDAREHDVQQRMKDKAVAYKRAKSQLKNMCVEMDADKSGALTLDEFLAGYDTNQQFADTLNLMDARRDDIPMIFSIIDVDKSGDVSCEEFVEQLYKLKYQNTHTMLAFMQHSLNEIRDNMFKQVKVIQEDLVARAGVHEEQLNRIAIACDLPTISSRPLNTTLRQASCADVDGFRPDKSRLPHLLPKVCSPEQCEGSLLEAGLSQHSLGFASARSQDLILTVEAVVQSASQAFENHATVVDKCGSLSTRPPLKFPASDGPVAPLEDETDSNCRALPSLGDEDNLVEARIAKQRNFACRFAQGQPDKISETLGNGDAEPIPGINKLSRI